jgi:hypothetical protein
VWFIKSPPLKQRFEIEKLEFVEFETVTEVFDMDSFDSIFKSEFRKETVKIILKLLALLE